MLKVLIVDDSLIIRKKISYIFENLGQHNILTATNGKEAIDSYKKYKPDLVTMDITMPDMDGIAAVKEILKINKNAKVIMCSAMGQKPMIKEALEAGAKDFIIKPFDKDKAIKIIEAVAQN
jgi:two-component system chemotaxis response regulator CheY